MSNTQRIRAFRTELNPNNKQRSMFYRHAGCARFVFNWGLQRKKEVWWMNQLPLPHIKTPTAIDLHRELVVRKKQDWGWMYEMSKCAPQEALRDLDRAFKNFFENRTNFPRFKSRHDGVGSFRLTGRFQVEKDRVYLTRIGWVRLKERGYLPSAMHVLSITISERAGRWYASLCVMDERLYSAPPPGEAVGVDLGITTLATVSDGTVFENPRAMSRRLRKLKRLHREVSRKQEGSKNREKAKRRLSRAHVKTADLRRDAMHKATTTLARTKPIVVVESLRPQNMQRNHHLAQSVADASFGEFIRQMEYKCGWYGSRLVKADPFYPSTKRCSNCGSLQEMPLSKRMYRCQSCGLVIERDLNASRNLAMLAASSAESLNACGGRRFMPETAGAARGTRNLPASVASVGAQVQENGEGA